MIEDKEIWIIISVILFSYGLISTIYFKLKIRNMIEKNDWLINYKDRKFNDCSENYLKIIDGWRKKWDESQIK